MIIRGPRKQTNFTILPNDLFEAGLTAEATGVLCFLLSKSEGWNVNAVHLARRFNCGRERISRIMHEIEGKGYATLRRGGKEGGSDWIVLDSPVVGKPDPRKTRPSENPTLPRTDTNQGLISTKNGNSCALFDRWWEAYPKKVAKKSCLAKWKGMGLEARGEALIADVRKRLRLDRKWKEDYAPNPLTYLNGERWEDQIEPVRPERPVNGVPTTPRGWHSWCKGNGLGDGPRGYSEDQFVAWAQQKHKEKNA